MTDLDVDHDIEQAVEVESRMQHSASAALTRH